MKSSVAIALTLAAYLVLPMAAAQSQDLPGAEDAVPAEIAVFAQRVYLDPATGRLTDKPPPGSEVLTLSPEELNMISTSHEGLVERPVSGGGVMVDLQGRFRHMAVATLAEDGTVEVREVAGEVFLPEPIAASSESEKSKIIH